MTQDRATEPDIWQNPDGTWSHHMDSDRPWKDREACATDLRFNREWVGAVIASLRKPSRYFK